MTVQILGHNDLCSSRWLTCLYLLRVPHLDYCVSNTSFFRCKADTDKEFMAAQFQSKVFSCQDPLITLLLSSAFKTCNKKYNEALNDWLRPNLLDRRKQTESSFLA